MILMVVSGGQTGADQSGWRAAKKVGFVTGGMMPQGFRTEDESGKGDSYHPEFKELYGAKESHSRSYPVRTEYNVYHSSVTLYFRRNRRDSAGLVCTRNAANKHFKPFWDLGDSRYSGLCPYGLFKKFRLFDYKILNVAGTRESSDPGIGQWAEGYLTEFLEYCLNRA